MGRYVIIIIIVLILIIIMVIIIEEKISPDKVKMEEILWKRKVH